MDMAEGTSQPSDLNRAEGPSCESHARKAAPRVIAVVLTWNDVEMARNCIASLYGNKYPGLQVVLVDNGSKIPVVQPLKNMFPGLVTLPLDRNYGFTGGCNRGIERALAMGAEYVFLLNNDTVVHGGAIDELVNCMARNPGAGMVSAMLIRDGYPKRVFSYHRLIDRNKARIYTVGDNTEWKPILKNTFSSDFVPACAVLFRRKALIDVGLFDESLFTNWEDYDLCLRFARAGYWMLFEGRAEVTHFHGKTTGKRSPFITYLSTRNQLICLFRYARWNAILWQSPFIAMSYVRKLRDHGWSNTACHRAFLLGLIHFVLGVRGKGRAPEDMRD
jgi:GT2 family glycosyltransferase